MSSRFFMGRDYRSGDYFIVPEMFRKAWDEWLTQPVGEEACPFFATNLAELSTLTFENPRF